MPDQNTINDVEKDLVSFRLDLDLSVKHSDTMMMEGGLERKEDLSLLN